MDCLTDNQINAFLEGNRSDRWEIHLSSCDWCRERLCAQMAENNTDIPNLGGLIDNTVSAAIAHNEKSGKQESHFLFFRRFRGYAFAAGLLLAAGITFYLSLEFREHKEKTPVSSKSDFEISPAPREPKNMPGTAQTPEKERTVYQFDEVEIFPSKKVVRGEIKAPHNKKSVVQLSRKTGTLVEERSKLEVDDNSDTVSIIRISQGTALFNVEPNKYDNFVVITPFAQVKVTGTIFSVTVEKEFAKVNVLEGSVDIIHETKKELSQSLLQGSSALINADSIVISMIESSLTLKARENLLKEYLDALDSNMNPTLHGAIGKKPDRGKPEHNAGIENQN
ncbi:MAG: hypothetical protein GF401_02555 [Chitinivibrionales bacterium]|nr:hypothetical protein [Chitinivibrionales bacterium]